MRAAAALARHAARVQRRTPVAARRWRPRPTQLRRNAWRCLSSKNDGDDDDGGPVAVTIDDDDSDAPASVGVGDGAPTPDRVLALALARRPLFPGMVHSLSLGPTAAAALQAERDAGRPYVALFLRKEPAEEHEAAELFTPSDLDECLDTVHGTGAFAQVHNVAEGSDGQSQALLLVHRRVDASTVVDAGPPPRLGVEHWPREAWIDEDDGTIPPTKTGRRKKDASRGDLVRALSNEIVAAIRELVQLNPLYREHMQYFTQRVDIADPFKLADFAASLATAKGPDLQIALEERDVVKRLRLALDLVSQERELSKLQQEISQQVETKLSSQQRTFLLNEQLKTIKKELGVETDDKDALVKKFRNRIASIEGVEDVEEESAEEKWKDGVIPAVARAAIEEELSKLEALEKNSAEFNVTRNYLDWLTGLPWGSVSGEVFDVAAAKEALDDVHYGMDDVKERILELVAVGSLVGGVRGKILCLVGPPGTGKTSIGSSIAQALGREFYRFSVGGLGDVAEIKGHRRTYVGAMPGKPIQCLKATKKFNPVVLIDEVDKLGRGGNSGDPASALLELLDPSQNANFLDHYLDVPVDLSRCLFVCTANDASLIPGPLLDRMEVVRLAGYDLEDKVAIARQHLVPKALEEAGLQSTDGVSFDDDALVALIRGHAREAGVRTLQKLVEKIGRKVALRVVRDNDPSAAATRPESEKGSGYAVTVDTLEDFVGKPRFSKDRLYDDAAPVGVVMGLAWTSMGGAALYVEATKLSGGDKGAPKLSTTGQLGSVMEESTRVALNHVRSRLDGELDGDELHIHVPDGATPKDGPSAGVTVATALLSLATDKPVRQDLAMTGELSLTGKVLPVGGIKEKVIAARRAGVAHVCLPDENRRDFDELPEHLKKDLEAHFAATFEDVVGLAFAVERQRCPQYLKSSKKTAPERTNPMGNSAYVPPVKESIIYPTFEAEQGSLAGKAYAVTGCTTGTGLVVAKLFAKKGAARVFLLNRPSPRAEAALAAVQAVAAEECIVTHVDCDLADFDSVRQAAAQVAAETKESGLDVLANNAGVMALADRATKDGYDIQMQTNHLSHFLLTRELHPALQKAVELRGEARIVNHSSFARNGPPGTKLTAENCKLYLGKNGGDLGGDGASMICGGARWVRYAYTKLANVCFTLALHDKLGDSGVKALCAAPGLVATELQATTARDGGMGSGTWFMRWSQSPEDGAVPLLHCCLSSAVSSGELWEPKGVTGPPVLKDPLEKVCLEADRDALWAASEAAVGEWDLDL